MIRPAFTSLMPLSLAPACAFAGAAPGFGVGGPVDRFSMAVGNPVLSAVRLRDRIGISLFASASDETVVVPPRCDESDGSELDPTGPVVPQADIVTAYDVYSALLSIPIRHNVLFNDQDLVYLLGTRGWIREILDGERKAMKAVAARLGPLEAELDRVDRLVKEEGSLRKRFDALVSSLRRRKRVAMSTGLFRDLKVKKQKLEEEVERARIASEWSNRIASSNAGYVFLTDKGSRVLAALEGAKDDPRMQAMSVDDYLKLIKARV